MSKAAISLKNITKTYHQGSWPFQKPGKSALKDVSFEIEQGQCFGIIGKNGAGKSTLLKIIAGITEPTKGIVSKIGRIASLIELGNGFHQDLSGLENLRFNAALLGMSPSEIHSKTDEIVSFAQLESVINDPIRTYSTGMVMRLGFSIAAHLDTEIVLLDEVLAVGDSFFQQKCIEKIFAMKGKGRTVVVVSHQAELIRRLCDKTALLENGMLQALGSTDDVLKTYLQLGKAQSGNVIHFEPQPNKASFVQLKWETYPIPTQAKAIFELTITAPNTAELDFGFKINDLQGRSIMHISNRFLHQTLKADTGINVYKVEIEHHLLPGEYHLTCFLRIGEEVQHWVRNGVKFEISGPIMDNYENPNEIQGIVNGAFSISKTA